MVCVTFDDNMASAHHSMQALNPWIAVKEIQSQRRMNSITRSNFSPNGGYSRDVAAQRDCTKTAFWCTKRKKPCSA